ncbi:MAG: elongation factor G [bacterium]|nr:elongation factor G [bacterium]
MGNAELSRNYALIGHGGDGKTTLADGLLMAAGVTSRLGSVEEGSSYMNWLPEERTRRTSISASICSYIFDGDAFTVIDAPGDSNFAGELEGALNAVDCALLVLSGRDGVKVGTERAFQQARERGVAVAAVANKLDLERADLSTAAAQLEELLGVRAVKLHLPIGAGESFTGFVDLLSGKAHTYPDDASGTVTIGDPPDDLDVESARLEMIEAIAEADDAIMEKYLEDGQISNDELLETLTKGLNEGTLMPVFCASAVKNIGPASILGTIDRIFPSSKQLPPRKGMRGEEEVELTPDGPVAAYVFKSVADRYAGMLSVMRVVSGRISKDMTLLNPRTGTKERISKLLKINGEETHDTTEAGPGEIVAIPKLKDTHSGDTLCDDKNPVTIIGSDAPHGVISFSVEATNKGDEDKVFESLNRLVEEDRSLTLGRDERTGEFLLTGLGQLHIEVAIDKLKRMFGVDVTLKPPKVPYLETIHGHAEHVEGKLKKQSGGRGQFGVCFLSIEPGARGSGVTFADEIVGGSIPRQFIPAVEKGVRETCERGVVAGYKLTDIVVRCIDGKHHPVDSSEMAFKTAGSVGLKAAVAQSKPVLLEPIMSMEVSVPDESVGDVMGNLNSRRGRVEGVESRGAGSVVKAHVPMSEVLSYASDLTSMTGGQGSFHMEFDHYDEVPSSIQQKIITEAAKEEED